MRLALTVVALALAIAACGLAVTGAGSPGESDDAAVGDASMTSDAGTSGEDAQATSDAPSNVISDATTTTDAPPQGCSKRALVLSDGDEPSVDGAASALASAGFTVTKVKNFASYNGTAPRPVDQDVIVLLMPNVPATYPSGMPSAGERAIADAIKGGVGLVFEEWIGYWSEQGLFPDLRPYVLFDYDNWSEDGVTMQLFAEAHPIWTGLPATFSTIAKTSVAIGRVRTGARPTTVIANGTLGTQPTGPVVLTSDDGTTRIAETALIANDLGRDDALSRDPNIRTLFANMALWAARCR